MNFTMTHYMKIIILVSTMSITASAWACLSDIPRRILDQLGVDLKKPSPFPTGIDIESLSDELLTTYANFITNTEEKTYVEQRKFASPMDAYNQWYIQKNDYYKCLYVTYRILMEKKRRDELKKSQTTWTPIEILPKEITFHDIPQKHEPQPMTTEKLVEKIKNIQTEDELNKATQDFFANLDLKDFYQSEWNWYIRDNSATNTIKQALFDAAKKNLNHVAYDSWSVNFKDDLFNKTNQLEKIQKLSFVIDQNKTKTMIKKIETIQTKDELNTITQEFLDNLNLNDLYDSYGIIEIKSNTATQIIKDALEKKALTIINDYIKFGNWKSKLKDNINENMNLLTLSKTNQKAAEYAKKKLARIRSITTIESLQSAVNDFLNNLDINDFTLNSIDSSWYAKENTASKILKDAIANQLYSIEDYRDVYTSWRHSFYTKINKKLFLLEQLKTLAKANKDLAQIVKQKIESIEKVTTLDALEEKKKEFFNNIKDYTEKDDFQFKAHELQYTLKPNTFATILQKALCIAYERINENVRESMEWERNLKTAISEKYRELYPNK